MPTAIEANIKDKSRGSFIGFLNLTIDMAPTNAKALAIFDPIITMIKVMVNPTKNIVIVTDFECA